MKRCKRTAEKETVKERTNTYKKALWILAWVLAAAELMGQMGIQSKVLAAECAAETQTEGGRVFTAGSGVAEMGEGKASIMITGAAGQTLAGQQFHVYTLFVLEIGEGGGKSSYRFNPVYEQTLKKVTAEVLSREGKETEEDDVTESMAFQYLQDIAAEDAERMCTEADSAGEHSRFCYFMERFRSESAAQKIYPDTVNVTMDREDHSVWLTGLSYGCYIVSTVSGEEKAADSLCMLNTQKPEADIEAEPADPPTVKKIREDDENDGIADPEKWNDIGDYEIGQAVPYQVVSQIPNLSGYETCCYVWHDRMDEALSLDPDSVRVEISGQIKDQEKTYELTADEFCLVQDPADSEDTFRVSIEDMKGIIDREFPSSNGGNVYGQTAALTYQAVLGETAAARVGRPGFENEVCLQISKKMDGQDEITDSRTGWDRVVCFTYQLTVESQNEQEQALAGARFRLYADEACENEICIKELDGTYAVINPDSSASDLSEEDGGSPEQGDEIKCEEMITGEDGLFTVCGLDSGTYYLKETGAPDGYTALSDPVMVEIRPVFAADRDSYGQGEDAAETPLQKLGAQAWISRAAREQDGQELEADAESGNVKLIVVNRTGIELPATGTPAAALMTVGGTGLMTLALWKSRKKAKG